jgi:uncharacterized protein YjgD (DUF1641 family)
MAAKAVTQNLPHSESLFKLVYKELNHPILTTSIKVLMIIANFINELISENQASPLNSANSACFQRSGLCPVRDFRALLCP